MKISAVVITRNEQEMIGACLDSVAWADEVLVIDNGSVDKTAETARKKGVRVLNFENDDFSAVRNFGMKEANGDWVFYVDSDERVLKSLREEITAKLQDTHFSAFAISRKNIIFGQKVSYGPYKKDWMIRLFKKDKFETWVGKVHEYGKFKGDLGYANNSLLHLTHRGLDHFVSKALEWSKIDAKLRFDAGHPKMTKLRFLRILSTQSYEELIKRRGLFGGTVGIVDSVLQIFSFYMTYVRLWQMQQTEPLEQTYKEIDKELIANDFQYL